MIMNNILELKGKRFFQESRSGGGGGASMNSKKEVTMEQVSSLIDKLNSGLSFGDMLKAMGESEEFIDKYGI